MGLLRFSARAAILGVLAAVGAAAAERPNVVVILSDDQGWGDLSVHGNANLSTPNIDSLARDGALFDRFYVCPVCSPTRAEFLTGRYHPRGGVYSTSTGGERLDLDERTIGDAFKAAGYATGAFGKWHNGMQYPYHPNGRGFDEYYGFCSGHWGTYFDPPLEHNGTPVRGKGFIIDDLTDRAIAFIEGNKGRPFFCYLPYNSPHSPMQVPDRFFEKFKEFEPKMRNREPEKEDLPHLRAALAMCENIDWNVGRVLTQLEESGLAANTIVLYFSDNGPNGVRWNGDMKGRKGSTDEGGVRVPMLVRWPGRIKPGTKIAQIAGAIDLLPTLAEAAGIALPKDRPLDGISVLPLLLGSAKEWPDRMIFSHWNNKVSVRTQRYRFDAQGKLFDMLADPGQRTDAAKTHPEVATRLGEAVAKWKGELLPGLGEENRAYTVGYRAFPVTCLPARDGVPHGNVRRSAKAPNCSFFEGWSTAVDCITWDVEVATAGRYEATIDHTCAAANVGCTVEMAFLDASIRKKVTEAHDPPLYGMEHDRCPRGTESYVKDFKALNLGIIELKKGLGELTLRAPEIPGKGAIDVRQVTLKLLE